MKRREFIQSGTLALGGLSLTAGGELLNRGSGALAASNDRDPFSRQFNIPSLNTGKRNGKQVKFDLTIQTGHTNFVGNLDTPTMGINGSYLGPVLRAQRDDRVSFSVTNNLPEITTLHWHGFILPAKMDGGMMGQFTVEA